MYGGGQYVALKISREYSSTSQPSTILLLGDKNLDDCSCCAFDGIHLYGYGRLKNGWKMAYLLLLGLQLHLCINDIIIYGPPTTMKLFAIQGGA